MAVDDRGIPQLANERPEEKYLNRHVVGEVAGACAIQPDVWRDLGIELLGQDGSAMLDTIKANNPGNVTTCCRSMLTIWRQRQPDASWSQLITALKEVKLNQIATEIEKRLKSPAEQQDDQPRDQQTKQEDNLLKESSKVVLPSQTHESDVNKSKAMIKFSKSLSIDSAFTRMTSQIETILEEKKFSKLRRACVQRINSLGSNLPQHLVPKIQHTKTMDEMLDVFAQSPYWNWFDTRLLEALVSASGSPEAEEWLESFKATFYAKKVTEVIPYVSIKHFNEFIEIVEKFDKDPKDLTISELLEHKFKLECEVLDIDEGELVLSCIKTGCVELKWQVPLDSLYQVYTSMNKKRDQLASLAIKSLICEVADEFIAGLPVVLRGQEVTEVGPIEPLPEHVRQEPYSLPQGFHWVTLSSSDGEEITKFSLQQQDYIDHFKVNYNINYPNTKSEWQFGIRTNNNNKLVGVVITRCVHIYVGETSMMCMYPNIAYHLKYRKNKIFYILNKELMRRVNLNKINQFIIFSNSLLKPVTTYPIWRWQFNYRSTSQLPSSPGTPGWRRMTPEDLPSALAFINQWSSQFEIRQVFDSEEELSHYLLCPILPNYAFTYVVRNKAKNITDLVRYLIFKNPSSANITTVISTRSPVKQLILDALVCARNDGATSHATMHQYNVKHEILSSLSFQQVNSGTCHIYNYKYHEIPHDRFWFTI